MGMSLSVKFKRQISGIDKLAYGLGWITGVVIFMCDIIVITVNTAKIVKVLMIIF